MSTTWIGQSVGRIDGRAKVTGNLRYLEDLRLDDMLHVAIVRSLIPHGRIKEIEVTEASSQPGVVQVVTAQDLEFMANSRWGPAYLDQSVLAIEKARYIGEPVAAVVANSLDAAREAAKWVDVSYEEESAVFDPIEAMQEDAPMIHQSIVPAQNFADLARVAPGGQPNICFHYKLRAGDTETALKQAPHLFEDVFTYPSNQYCAIEPHLSMASVDDAGNLTVWSNTQTPYIVRSILMHLLGMPPDRVRVISGHIGGGFGGKSYMKLEPLAAVLAILTGKPVRVKVSQEEEFVTINNHAATITLRTGVGDDGKIIGRACEVVWDTGSYADIGPRITQKSGMTASGPYNIPNVQIDSYCVYTNKPPAGAIRGFGIPQVAWAYESQMDIIAERLGLDPVEIRLRNLLKPGEKHATGTPVHDVDLHQEILRTAEALEWGHDLPSSPNFRYGRGIAVGIKAVVTPSTSEARVQVQEDGKIRVLSSTVDMGQGSETALAQIAAEIFNVDPETIELAPPDTYITPFDMLTGGSRSTFHMGIAVRHAALDVRNELIKIGSMLLEEEPSSVELVDGFLRSKTNPRHQIPIGSIVQRSGAGEDGIIKHTKYSTDYEHGDPETGQSSNITAFWMTGVTGVEVAVDVETGKVRVTRCVAEGNAGRAVNPRECNHQLLGGAIYGIGHALQEKIHFDEGQVINGSFADYKIPGFGDVAEDMEGLVIEVPRTTSPIGAIGIGETGIFTVAPAIANAVAAATGVRITELPLTPEKVLQELRQSSKERV